MYKSRFAAVSVLAILMVAAAVVIVDDSTDVSAAGPEMKSISYSSDVGFMLDLSGFVESDSFVLMAFSNFTASYMGDYNGCDTILTPSDGNRIPAGTFNYEIYCLGTDFETKGSMTVVAVSFEAEGASGSMDQVLVSEGFEYQLPEPKFSPESGKSFLYWTIGDKTYNAGDKVAITENTTVKAVYSSEVVLSAIAVVTEPTRAVYTVGDRFDPAGMVVKAIYTDKSEKTLSNESLVFVPAGSLTVDDSSVIVSYTEGKVTKTATVSITVSEKPTMATITWKNGDKVLATEQVEYGKVPVYSGETPVKEADAQYTYTFKEWTPEVVAVTGNATYTAVFTETVNKYEITWKNGDKVLATEQVEYGKVPVYSGETPVKEADAQYTYTFKEWTPEVVAVTGNATYTAVFTETVNKYEITWKNGDKVLATEQVEYGKVPVYSGETPVKEADAQYTYTFKEWTPEVVAVTGNATYTAVFTETVNKYEITWKNGDKVLATEQVEYGKVPVYSGETPVKEADAQYTYTFKEWTPEVVAVTGNATYTAVFTETVNKYSVEVKFDPTMGSAVLYNGEKAIDSGSEVEYGTSIVVKIAQTEGYKLTGLKDNGKDCTVALEYTFTVDAKHVIEVVFTKTTEISYTVSIEAIGNGTVSPSKDGSCIMYGEQSQVFKVSADFGWKIKSLTLDGEEISGGSKILKEVSIVAIDADHKIAVEFVEAERYTVDVSETSHGKVRIEGLDADGKAVEGRTITIVSTPDFGCFVSKIVINGDALFSTTGAEKSDSRTIAVDRYVSEQGTISIDVQFAYSASDDDDDPVPVPVPTPSQKSDDGDDNSGAIVAVVAGCVAVAIIAILVVAMRKE